MTQTSKTKNVSYLPFCGYHFPSRENPSGTDCGVDIGDGVVVRCPYSPRNIKYDSEGVFVSKAGRGERECPHFTIRANLYEETRDMGSPRQQAEKLVKLTVRKSNPIVFLSAV